MHGHQDDPAVPEIADVPRAFCKDHCAAWSKRKDKNGNDASYCGKTVMPPGEDGKRLCACSWARIREKMRS